MNLTAYKKYLVILVTIMVMLSGCGGGSCLNGGTSNLTLKLTAPNEYPVGVPVTAYLTMTNTSAINANNLQYAVPDSTNYTGATITVANGANQPCRNIPAGQSCTFTALIGANSHAGSFTVTATPNSTAALNRLKSALSLQSNVLSLTANIGLANVPANSQTGANGITFLYAQTIAGSSSAPTQISIVGVVNSTNVGNFNTINLTDSTGKLLNFTVLSGNSGSNLTNLARGSVVTFLLTIPAGTTSYQFYAQSMENGAIVSQGTTTNPIMLANSLSGILTVQPTSFNLYAVENYTQQVVTYTNIGKGQITGLNIAVPTGPFSVTNNCTNILNSGASCTVTLISNAGNEVSGSTSLVATSSAGKAVSQFNYAGVGAGATVALSAVNNFIFTANTTQSSQSTQLTIQNTGNEIESNFVFSFGGSPYFNLAPDTTGSNPCILTGNTVAGPLAAGASCSVILSYTNATITSNSTANMLVDYFANGSPVSAINKTLSYSTVQAVASLGITTSQSCTSEACTFATIAANNSESSNLVITIINNGSANASAISLGTITGNASYFSVLPVTGAGDCQNPAKQTLAVGENCTLTLQFGPSATANSSVSAVLPLIYTAAASAPPTTLNIGLLGAATAVTTATPVVTSVAFSPTASGGDGESANGAFQIGSSSAGATITLTYANIGSADAANFSIDTDSTPAGYTYVSGTCSNFTLSANSANSCNMVFSFDNSSIGSIPFDLSGLTGSWTSGSSTPTGQQVLWQTGSSQLSTIYVNVYQAAVVTAVMSSESSGSPVLPHIIESNLDFYVVYTLTGGYQVSSQTYGVSFTGPLGSPPISAYAPNTCTLSGTSPTCTIRINSGGNTVNQVINYMQSSATIAPTPASSPIFNVALPGVAQIYVTNGSESTVAKCYESSGGLTCLDSGAAGLATPTGIVFNESYTIAYVANNATSTISVCAVDQTYGNLSCADSGVTSGTFVNPAGMTIYNGYLYVTNSSIQSGGNIVVACQADPTIGALSNCAPVVSAPSSGFVYPAFPTNIYFLSGYSYVYVPSANAGINRCVLDSGNLTICEDAGGQPQTTFNQPSAINPTNNSAIANTVYITNAGNTYLATCFIGTNGMSATGTFTGCSNAIFDNSVNISGYSNGAVANSDGSTIYILNGGSNNIIRCSASSSGGYPSFTNCIYTAQTGLNGANGIYYVNL